jgi:hypothetical protein
MHCKPARPTSGSLQALVAKYADDFKELDKELRNWRHDDLPFTESIRLAVCGLGANGKMHDHQHRSGRDVCEEAAAILRRHSRELQSCNTFEELIALIKRLTDPVHMFGELCQYDAAVRIGVHLGIKPEYVYVHRGALKGARKLRIPLTRSPIARWRIVAKLPDALRHLPATHVENFLCWIS